MYFNNENNNTINPNTDSIYSKYNDNLLFTATDSDSDDGYYTVDIDEVRSTINCSVNDDDKQGCLRAGNNHIHQNTLNEYPDRKILLVQVQYVNIMIVLMYMH